MNTSLLSLSLQPVTVVLAVVIAALVVVLVAVARRQAAPQVSSVGTVDPEVLLAPVRELIGGIARRVDGVVTESTATSARLDTQIKTVLDAIGNVATVSGDLRDTTTRISTALGGSGVRGTWGQVTLRRVVELAGLVKHVTFAEQKGYSDSDGDRLTPDMVVHLPGDRRIVVDAKASGLNLDGTLDGKGQLKAIKDRINDLATKAYTEAVGAVEAIVMFVPSESILASAFDAEPKLGEYAMERKIALATPMTLYTVLRTVEMGWLEHSREENAHAIVAEATELVQRLATFIEHFQEVGTGLQDAIAKYNAAAASYNRLLFPHARDMRTLGAKATKPAAAAPLVDPDAEQIRQD
jgi:DNA recombination protein RmuC